MKGQIESIVGLVVTLLVIIGISISLGIAWGWEEGINKQILLHKDAYMLSNALDSAETYLETALHYSVYQSIFDVGLAGVEGGKYNHSGVLYSYWYKNGDISPTGDSFILIAQNKVAELMKKYTGTGFSFADPQYVVGFPKELKITSSFENNVADFGLHPTDRMEIEWNESDYYAKFEREASLDFEMKYRLFETGKEFVRAGDIKNRIESYLSSLKTYGMKEAIGCENKDAEISDTEILGLANGMSFADLPEAQKAFAGGVNDSIKALETAMNENSGKLAYSIKAAEITVNIAPACSETKKTNCAVKNGEFSLKKECNFIYTADAVVLVGITDKEKYYPVKFGGKAAFRSMELAFAVEVSTSNPTQSSA